jgi:hypothetical protein
VLLPLGFYHLVSTHLFAWADVVRAARAGERRRARLYAELDVARLDAAALELLDDRHSAELAYARSVGDEQLAARASERIAALQAQREAQAQR